MLGGKSRTEIGKQITGLLLWLGEGRGGRGEGGGTLPLLIGRWLLNSFCRGLPIGAQPGADWSESGSAPALLRTQEEK